MENTGPHNRAEIMRDEMLWRDRIREVLAGGPRTIPAIAEALGRADWEVTLWVMGMRRFGLIEEQPKGRADDYYSYRLAQ
jgi:hypothetical protein